MGFDFKTEDERNPRKTEEVQLLEQEIASLNEFLELIGRAHIYDMWKYDKQTGEQTIDIEEWK